MILLALHGTFAKSSHPTGQSTNNNIWRNPIDYDSQQRAFFALIDEICGRSIFVVSTFPEALFDVCTEP